VEMQKLTQAVLQWVSTETKGVTLHGPGEGWGVNKYSVKR